ncbi:hypothetical protein A6A04_08230 [Paramagnetospirillum marisnigri]|uniref:Lipoprotein n=1 Tax=Paramagnetospirillum marisnigri TaxID=1285242 RepID=A0A178M8D5_9PROT|nr:hypothetical protein [Paramagnetospirillum marisnigri]OAN44793.1 hypothetical protein A6A04_08230 [Paramagnetospirillum marisnigri]
MRARGVWLVAVVILLVGCNAEERGHVVRLDKGGYKGMADTAISDATRDALRARQAWQSEGSSRAVTAQGGGLIPTGEAQATGRIAGQRF